VRLAAALLAGVLLLTGCTSSDDEPDGSPSAAPSVQATPSSESPGLSNPVEDEVYPEVGDPGVDALAYALDIAWDPDARTMTGRETVRLRATADADHLQLDLSADLEIGSVTVDGADAAYEHHGKDLRISGAVRADQVYRLVIEYAGPPMPDNSASVNGRSAFVTARLPTCVAPPSKWRLPDNVWIFTSADRADSCPMLNSIPGLRYANRSREFRLTMSSTNVPWSRTIT